MLVPGTHPKGSSETSNFAGFAKARDPSAWQDRRRGLSNFLTWSFFLAEILAADLFFGKGASAADQPDDPSKHATADTHSSGDASLPDDWRGGSDEAVPAEGNRLLHGETSPLGPNYGETAAMPALSGIGGRETALHGSAGGGGGGGSSISFSQDFAAMSGEPGEQAIHAGDAGSSVETLNFSTLDAATAEALGLELNPLQFELGLANDLLSGEPLDSLLDLKALGLDLHSETGLLTSLLGDLVSGGSESLDNTLGIPLSNLVEETTGLNLSGPADGLTSLLGAAEGDAGNTGVDDLTDLATGVSSQSVSPTPGAAAGIAPDVTDAFSLGHLVDMGSGDSIVFPGLSLAQDQVPADSLFSGGQYTDYNLAVQSASTDGTTGADSPSGAGSDLVGIDDLGLPGSELTGHAVDVALADLANADQELLRGLSI